MTKTALITFTPLEPYFFGGETTHGNGRERNYFSKSSPYPQQTTLLGTLRNLLRLSGYNYGKQSFSPQQANDYEKLVSLSPLFLQNPQGHFLLRQAIDRQPGKSALKLESMENNAWALHDNGDLEFSKQWENAGRWPDFKPKNKLVDEWISTEGQIVKPEEIFKIFNRPGIPKQELLNPKLQADGTPEPDAVGLFKQDLMLLEKGWTFCVLAEFTDDVDFNKLDGQNLQLGGEKSIFHTAVKEFAQAFEALFPAAIFYPKNPPEQPRLVLASDAWIPDTAWQYTIGAVTKTTDFRHISSPFGLANYGPLREQIRHKNLKSDTSVKLSKSIKYTLLARGSVLLCADKIALGKLDSALRIEPWHSVGFNHFITYCP